VFAVGTERPCHGTVPGVDPNSSDPKAKHPRFTELVFGFSADAYVEASNADSSGNPLRKMPTNECFFREWDRVLAEPRFANGMSAIQAAREEGVEIKIGIIFRAPFTPPGEKCMLSGFWWDGTALRGMTLAADRKTIQDAVGSLRGSTGILPPPYIAVAAVEPGGYVRKLWFHGIWTDGIHLALIDSGNERTFATKVKAAGGLFLKPPRIDDLYELLPILPPGAARIVWEHLPDFLVWWPDSAEPGLVTVVEVRGFAPVAPGAEARTAAKLADNEVTPVKAYNENFDAKQPFYLSLRKIPDFDYYVEPAWRYPRIQWSFQRSQWISPKIGRGSISRVASDLIRMEANSPIGAPHNTPRTDSNHGIEAP